MISTARHSRGLYLLDDDASSSNISRTTLLSSYLTTSEQDCMLWHFCLGHPYFKYTKRLFSHLFSKIVVFVTYVFEQKSIGFLFLHNLKNQLTLSHLFIVMPRDHPRQAPHLGNCRL